MEIGNSLKLEYEEEEPMHPEIASNEIGKGGNSEGEMPTKYNIVFLRAGKPNQLKSTERRKPP